MSGEVALDQLAQFIFHSASAEFSSTIRATNCFVNLNMGEGGGVPANISNENSFYFYPGFCILKKNHRMLEILSLFDSFSSSRIIHVERISCDDTDVFI